MKAVKKYRKGGRPMYDQGGEMKKMKKTKTQKSPSQIADEVRAKLLEEDKAAAFQVAYDPEFAPKKPDGTKMTKDEVQAEFLSMRDASRGDRVKQILKDQYDISTAKAAPKPPAKMPKIKY